MENALARQRYFPESHTDPSIVSKCISAEILLKISDLEKDSRCSVYLAKLRKDIDNQVELDGAVAPPTVKEDIEILRTFSALKGFEAINEDLYLI